MKEKSLLFILMLLVAALCCYLVSDVRLMFGVIVLMWANNIGMKHFTKEE